MTSFFMITPYRYDQLFQTKKHIVMDIAAQYYIQPFYAEFDIPLLTAGFQLEKTLVAIQRSNFIIADLTYERPSCYYEIGYAHGLQKRVYLIVYENPHGESYPPCEVHGIEEVKCYRDLETYLQVIDNIIRNEAHSSQIHYCTSYEN